MMTFTEHPSFTRQIMELLTDDEHREFQTELATNPEAGTVIPGLGGLRKVRLALPGSGKRGGARVLYLLFMRMESIHLVYVFTKGKLKDLPPDKRKAIKDLVVKIKQEMER